MNANELADVLIATKFQVDEDGTMIGVSHQAVDEVITMLRQFGLAESIIKQQQIEINAYKYLKQGAIVPVTMDAIRDLVELCKHQADYIAQLENGLESSIKLNKAQAERNNEQ